MFSFYPSDGVAHGLDQALQRYREIAADVKLAGPTSFAPIIYQALRLIADNGHYHILVIIADGQVGCPPPRAQQPLILPSFLVDSTAIVFVRAIAPFSCSLWECIAPLVACIGDLLVYRSVAFFCLFAGVLCSCRNCSWVVFGGYFERGSLGRAVVPSRFQGAVAGSMVGFDSA